MSKKTRARIDSALVYSTDTGGRCPQCNKRLQACVCGENKAPDGGDGVVRLLRETKGRKGKGVTLVHGLPLSAPDIATLAKKLKSGCGVGGSVKSGVIELQTAEREKVKTILEAAGFRVKISGG